jgi:hypothetical protein
LPRHFDRSVSIFVGLGFPREVRTPLEAFQVLTEWTGRRGPDHAEAIVSCREALVNDADLGKARGDFEAFARNQGILAPDALEISAARYAREWQQPS